MASDAKILENDGEINGFWHLLICRPQPADPKRNPITSALSFAEAYGRKEEANAKWLTQYNERKRRESAAIYLFASPQTYATGAGADEGTVWGKSVFLGYLKFESLELIVGSNGCSWHCTSSVSLGRGR